MQLSEGQANACKVISDFILGKNETYPVRVGDYEFTSDQVICLSGAAGTGKTTVIKYVLDHLAKVRKLNEKLNIKNPAPTKVILTATTNKAAEAFEKAFKGSSVRTIHSVLRLVMMADENYNDRLTSSRPGELLSDCIIFTDEASYIDDELVMHMKAKTGKNVKWVFMGDKAQCKTASGTLPIFGSEMPMVELTKIMRQADDNPIQKLSASLREWVLTGGPVPPSLINNKDICWVPPSKFEELIVRDMSRDAWTYDTSKVLAFTNQYVSKINKLIYAHINGTPILRAGDYAVNNNYIAGIKNVAPGIRTDGLVYLTEVTEGEMFGRKGYFIYTDDNPKGKHSGAHEEESKPYFMPRDRLAKTKQLNAYLKERNKLDIDTYEGKREWTRIEREANLVKCLWVDFRPVYACTIHKSQGSTFDRIFINLGDLNRCHDVDQLRRLLYVGISRARSQIIMTGDISHE